MNIPATFTESACHFAPQFSEVVQIGGTAEPQKFEVHQITVASDLTSGYNILLANNEFIKNHYAEPGFMVQLISLQAHSGDTYTIGYAYNGNRKLYADNVCGMSHNISTSGGHNSRTATANCYTVNYQGIPYVTSGGDIITANTATNAAIKAGDYLIILSVAEV